MGGGRGQAKIDVYNYCVIISPFEEIYDEFFQRISIDFGRENLLIKGEKCVVKIVFTEGGGYMPKIYIFLRGI